MKRLFSRIILSSVCIVMFVSNAAFSAIKVEINNVVQNFLDNPIRAEQMFMNQEVQTEGEVVEIRRGDNGGFVIVLKEINRWENYVFHCWLADETLNTAANISNENKIGIRGTIYRFHQIQNGIFISGNIVSLRDSVITHILTKAQLEFRQKLIDARNGNQNSQFSVGLAYANGDGTEKNLAEAARWYREAANRGHARATNNLGVMYLNGSGVEQNNAEAMKLFRQAADKGDTDGMHNVAVMYENGKGTEKNINEAVNWYNKAAQKKNKHALNRLKALAEANNAQAQVSLGYIYYSGEGAEKNYSEAFRLYTNAIKAGNPTAFYALGLMYETGNGTAKNLSEAERLYKLAAEQRNTNAMFRLAKIYGNRNGDRKEYILSIRYLKQAMNGGNQEAKREYEKGRKTFTNLLERLQQLRQKAARGDKGAKQALAQVNSKIDSEIGRNIFNAVLAEFGLIDNSSAQSSSGSGQYVITGTKVNVRSSANTKARVVIQLNTGDPVTVLEVSRKGRDTWYKIRTSDGTTGWVYGDYITQI